MPILFMSEEHQFLDGRSGAAGLEGRPPALRHVQHSEAARRGAQPAAAPPICPHSAVSCPPRYLRAVYEGREMKLTCRAAAASSHLTTTRTAESAWSAPNRRPERA